MYNQKPQASGLAGIISGLGNALGIIAIFVLAPPLYEWVSPSIIGHLVKYWGHDFSEILMVVVGLCLAYITFASVSLVFNFTVTCLVAAFAARRLSKGGRS